MPWRVRVFPNLARPLAVDWTPEDRADLEVAMKQGVAVVAYDCKQARILRDCRVDGNYGFVGTTLKEQVIHSSREPTRSSSTCRSSVPGLVAQCSATRPSMLRWRSSGEQVASRPVVSKADRTGDCADATHFVREATIGAFVTKQSATGKAEAAADILSMGASGSSTSSKQVINSDGDPADCRAFDLSAKSPSPRCSSLLRLELKAIATTPVQSDDHLFTEYATQNTCPAGTVFEGGKCARAKSSVPHPVLIARAATAPGNAGEGTPRVARVWTDARAGRGRREDPAKAAARYDQACKGADVPACSRLGEMLLAGTGVTEDATRAMPLLHKACVEGWMRAGRRGTRVRDEARPPSGPEVAAAMLRGCDGGDADLCASLGAMYRDGFGFTVDAERAFDFFKRGCSAGSKFGCVLLGEAYFEGRGSMRIQSARSNSSLWPAKRRDSSACDWTARLYFMGTGSKERREGHGVP